MIEVKQVSKQFDDICALNDVSFSITDGSVYGIVGTNGAGKSTMLRVMAGILKAEHGEVLVDGQGVFENPEAKKDIVFIPDTSYFFPNARLKDMVEYYSVVYPGFEKERFTKFCNQFDLDKDRKLTTFSKGMKKQVSVLLGVCANTKYMFCDETFDGLDPVVRQAVKGIFAAEILNRKFTPVIASHNLRELEDICEHVGLLHEGGILLSKDLEDMKFHLHKVQCVVPDETREEQLLKELEVLKYHRQGSLLMITARGTRTEIMNRVEAADPIFSEIIPLSLEEIFISETEVAGYEIKNIIL